MAIRKIAAMAGAFAASALVAGTVAAAEKAGLPGGFDDVLTIENVDAAHKTFTAGEEGRSQKFTVDDATYLFKQDRRIQLGDLAPGDRVAVSYPLTEKGRDRVPAKVVQVVTRAL